MPHNMFFDLSGIKLKIYRLQNRHSRILQSLKAVGAFTKPT